MSFLTIPTIMIIGLGFMGTNHYNNLKVLENEGKVKIVSVVDADQNRTKDYKNGYSSVKEAFDKTDPDIITICSNTQTHFTLISDILNFSKDSEKKPALFIEKPLVANIQEATAIEELLKKNGYGSEFPITCGYIFGESPALKAGIEKIQKENWKIVSINSTWQKNRMEKGPPRPTEGVHIDEATHPIDAIVNKILRQLHYDTSKVVIETAEIKRESELGCTICDRERQEELYSNDPLKLDPIGEVTYSLTVAGIPIEGFSSYAKGPQKREIEIVCEKNNRVTMLFDVEGSDRLIVTSKGKEEEVIYSNPNKLLREWNSFLQYVQTGEPSFTISSLDDMVFDVKLTDAFEKVTVFPHVISRN